MSKELTKVSDLDKAKKLNTRLQDELEAKCQKFQAVSKHAEATEDMFKLLKEHCAALGNRILQLENENRQQRNALEIIHLTACGVTHG